MKRAYFFVIDALIALLIIVSVIAFSTTTRTRKEVSYNELFIFLAKDSLNVLTELKTFETNNSYVQGLVQSNSITKNISLIRQISLFLETDKNKAKRLCEEMLKPLNITGKNIGLWINNELVCSFNKTSIDKAKTIIPLKSFVSGTGNETIHNVNVPKLETKIVEIRVWLE